MAVSPIKRALETITTAKIAALEMKSNVARCWSATSLDPFSLKRPEFAPPSPNNPLRKFLPLLFLSLSPFRSDDRKGKGRVITREYEARTEREEQFSTRRRSVWSGHQRRNKKTLRTADVGARTTRKELQITRIVSESWLAAAREGILNKAAAALQLADLETHGRYRF